jgi:hypothetical protein
MSSAATRSDVRLVELQILQRFKELLGREGDTNVTPFSADRIVCYKTNVAALDVPAIHEKQRELIVQAIDDVRQHQTARVILLTGNPGMGKSHLINYFARPELAAQHGYIMVRPGNDWRVNEFEEALLDALLAALVHPSPNQPHLLSERVEAIAFTALDQLLHQPGSLTAFRKRGARGWLGRTVEQLLRTERTRLIRKAARRELSVFRSLDFLTFTGYICDRFLTEPGNPLHRYVLRVLLCSLFPRDRERVHHWFRRVSVGDYFLRKFGVEEGLDAAYKRMAAIRLLISLFDREVSAGLLGADGQPLAGRVFFLAFDQIEGRDELFEREDDWFKFFAYLSELYNSLPNVVILFTMTNYLRDRVHSNLEKQFQDRIHRDERFILRYVEQKEVLGLYRHRLDRWLGDREESLRRQIEAVDNPYLPFDQAQVLDMAEHQTPRGMLEVFDTRFRNVLLDLNTHVEQDYRLWRREVAASRRGDPFRDTEDHIETVGKVLHHCGMTLAASVGLGWEKVEKVPAEGKGVPALLLYFVHPEDRRYWVRVYLVRLPWFFNTPLEEAVELLSAKQRKRYSLWLVRPGEMNRDDIEQRRAPGQLHVRLLESEAETTLQALLHVVEAKPNYTAEEWQTGESSVLAAVQTTYLWELFQHAAARMKVLLAGQEEPEEVSAPATPIQ